MEEEELFYAYLAGAIDCDGCISMTDKDNSVKCYVNLTQHEVNLKGMEEIRDSLIKYGYRISFTSRVAWAEKYDNLMYNINVRERATLIRLLPRLIPYFRFKKEKAEQMLAYLLDRDEKRPIIKGKPDTQAKRRYWTDAEHAELIRLHAEGYSNGGIAQKLNRSRESIGNRLSRHGVTR